VTISLVIGLFLFITGIKLPGVINSTMAGVAALNTPAAMIVLECCEMTFFCCEKGLSL
jgi:malate permease and related proteins